MHTGVKTVVSVHMQTRLPDSGLADPVQGDDATASPNVAQLLGALPLARMGFDLRWAGGLRL